mmetsp:Transcript_3283/g.3633  ORF Transcript_3283/g.3633 Transcript_3283/m.3633 type:complete len:214 (-) Transcript_3283:1048-1689(-)
MDSAHVNVAWNSVVVVPLETLTGALHDAARVVVVPAVFEATVHELFFALGVLNPNIVVAVDVDAWNREGSLRRVPTEIWFARRLRVTSWKGALFWFVVARVVSVKVLLVEYQYPHCSLTVVVDFVMSRGCLSVFVYTAVPVLDPMHGDWNTVVVFCVVTVMDVLCVAARVVHVVTEATVYDFFASGALIPNVVVAVGARKRKDGSLRRVPTEI